MFPWVTGVICEKCPPGQHISLTCKNHLNKRWSTKNLGYIGARSIFYNLTSDPDMGPECECDGDLLFHLHE